VIDISVPDGDLRWASGALPGSVHDKKAPSGPFRTRPKNGEFVAYRSLNYITSAQQ
jgi:hypothetical protein